jgi:NhaP-type Na+/H+ and K+/H+ antiporter
MIKPENINFLKKFISTSTMTWVICLSEIFTEFSELNPENHIEILKMSIAQNAYLLNKKLNNLKLARSKTEVVFLLKKGKNCIWCPSELFKFSKKDVIIKKEFALSMACKLTRSLLMQKVYLFQQDKLSDVLTENMKDKGLTVEYCLQ